MSKKEDPIFCDLKADDAEPAATCIESICVNCLKSGLTRLLLTKIPFYKEVVIMSFTCEFCGFENNEIQQAGEIQPKGCKYVLTVKKAADLNRKVIKSDYSSVQIPEVDLEIPSQSQKGEITTVEGIIARAITGLEQDQEKRRLEHPEIAKQIEDYIKKLQALKEFKEPFTLIVEDISGNCFIENPNIPHPDPDCKEHHFIRTTEQDHILGIYTKTEVAEESSNENKQNTDKSENLLKPIPEDSWTFGDLHGEVLQFQTICPNCKASCETNMKLTKIPHFKEVVIMATVCEACGIKTNEVKSGGGIEDKGVRFEIVIKDKEDLTRDVLKSETCSLQIPELECEVGSAAITGRFTTVEGLLSAMKTQLEEHGQMFEDSQDPETLKKLHNFTKEIDKIINLEKEATLVLDDIAGNSYVQSLIDDGPDNKLKITKYERSFEQNEELGLNDMKTENY